MTGISAIDHIRGDAFGLDMPAHAAAFVADGAAFLTAAFHAYGSLPVDNAVARIVDVADCPGGSTGHKLFLTIAYVRPDRALHTNLFVKFSRDFDDTIRDRGRFEMADEVRFAALSRGGGFPITVPTAYFGDYHADTGTGLLVTESIAFGRDGIEPHHEKCRDHELADALPHYRAVISALARLAGAHQSGRLPPEATACFPYDPVAAAATDPIRFTADELRGQVDLFARFATRSPQLFRARVVTPGVFAAVRRDAVRILAHEARIKRHLQSAPEMIALCHWNAHIDNAWFWPDPAGGLRCGLMDWGRVRQLNVAFALWGCLSGANLDMWDRHLDELLALFADELAMHGGARLDPATLKQHLILYAATMGVAQLLEAPSRILHRLPEAVDAPHPHAPVFLGSATARNQLQIGTILLNLWAAHDVSGRLDRLLA